MFSRIGRGRELVPPGAKWREGRRHSGGWAHWQASVPLLPACLFLTYSLLPRQPLYVAWILATGNKSFGECAFLVVTSRVGDLISGPQKPVLMTGSQVSISELGRLP
jgi:hypothetical protein